MKPKLVWQLGYKKVDIATAIKILQGDRHATHAIIKTRRERVA